MLNSWLSILPPLIVICAAAFTHNIHLSLICGILSGAFVATGCSVSQAWDLTQLSLFNTITNLDNILLYAFLIVLGILVVLLNKTESTLSFCRVIIKKIRSPKQAQYSSALVSALLFIDDYLSILTTGYVMRPLMDKFHVSRAKLAFLVHSLAGPIVVLAPISSWVATLTAYINQSGVDNRMEHFTRILADPFFVYIRTIPFVFYSFFTIFSVWLIIYKNMSFGPMKAHDEDIPTNTIFEDSRRATMLDLLLPLFTLIFGIVIGFPFAGGFWLFGGEYTFIDSLKHNNSSYLVMLIASTLSLLVSFSIGIIRKSLNFSTIPELCKDGFSLMYSAIGMVFLATTLSGLLADYVGTGQYLASFASQTIPLGLLPFMFFAVAFICTIATGSAWGSFAIIIPISIPMLVSLSPYPLPLDTSMTPMLFPILGAIFSGAVCGNHISPMSETTMMTATSTNTDIFTHAYTQFPYTIPAIAATALSYLLVGYLTAASNIWAIPISLGSGFIVCTGLMFFLNKRG